NDILQREIMNIFVLHGPNLNLLGTREPEIYGSLTLEDIDNKLMELGTELGAEVKCLQSNHEGALIDALHDARTWANGVVFNPGGYTHTSVALRDAITAIEIPVIEVHLSNVYAREEFRHTSLISAVCKGKVLGLGWRSYTLGLRALVETLADP
ncbi:MAG TPA: type II 3-dehydroquinate dehydratase, partial [Anaerolineales bacterium]|nr:type II 3-dehydroquinate dehydratase [Anaerolineales bacterium]